MNSKYLLAEADAPRWEMSDAFEVLVVRSFLCTLLVQPGLGSPAPGAQFFGLVRGYIVDVTSPAAIAEGHGIQHKPVKAVLVARHARPPRARSDPIMDEYNLSPNRFLFSIAFCNAQIRHRLSCARAREVRLTSVSPRQNRSCVKVRP